MSVSVVVALWLLPVWFEDAIVVSCAEMWWSSIRVWFLVRGCGREKIPDEA